MMVEQTEHMSDKMSADKMDSKMAASSVDMMVWRLDSKTDVMMAG